jgi:LuxR family transcriptional regulator, maltose regulon positive regulatory protein
MYLYPSAKLDSISPTSSSLDRFIQVEKLTSQELRVVNFLASGLVPIDIAAVTNTKVSTVRTHLKSIRRKLDVHSNIHALHVARERGLLNHG